MGSICLRINGGHLNWSVKTEPFNGKTWISLGFLFQDCCGNSGKQSKTHCDMGVLRKRVLFFLILADCKHLIHQTLHSSCPRLSSSGNLFGRTSQGRDMCIINLVKIFYLMSTAVLSPSFCHFGCARKGMTIACRHQSTTYLGLSSTDKIRYRKTNTFVTNISIWLRLYN